GLQGNAKIGSYQTGATDLAIALPGGMSLTLSRQYDTTRADQSGDLGSGWCFCALTPEVHETLPQFPGEDLLGPVAAAPLKAGDKIYFTNPDCTRVGFTFKPIPIQGEFGQLTDELGELWEPQWVPDAGVADSLYGEWDFVTLDLSEGFAGH